MAAVAGFILYLLAGEGSFIAVAQFESESACTTAVAVIEASIGDRPRDGAFKCIEMQSMLEMMQKNGINMS